MRRRAVRSSTLRLVLEDRRVDELLARVRDVDMVLAEMEAKVADLGMVLERHIHATQQPSLPFREPGGY